MTTISSSSSSNGSYFLQSLPTTGNWMLDAVSNDTSDWMDPSSSGPDPVGLAANAFAKTHLVATSYTGTFAVNQGILTLQAQLAGTSGAPGQSVNILA